MVGDKKEQLVLDDRTAEGAANLVEAQFLLRHALLVEKEIVGVQLVVAEEVPGAAMPAIGTGLGHQVRDGSGAAAVLGRVVQAELLEFRDRVLDRDIVNTAT